ncbi:MAG: AAA family ATPase [Cyanobacteria bacterium P01_E01_bin.42]
MVFLLGYEGFSKIHDSANSQVYRARRVRDGQPVILKFLNGNYPSSEQIRRYKQEYHLICQLNAPGIIKAYSLEEWQRSYAIVLEDFGGISLKQWLQAREKLNLKEFLNLAIAITESLAQIHDREIIHKDINPANITFNTDTKEIKIIDFGIATKLSRENLSLMSPNILEGTLAYISPEQTGRMNRLLDYRTDFYSLGVTFYEMLTEQLPFRTEDALELVHCHIAKTPPQFKIQNPEFKISPILQEVIGKLMAKNAEDRYQSASGLKADLEYCLQQLEVTREVSNFALARHDIASHLHVPQKLYGREKEIEILHSAFNRTIAMGTVELMLVSGYSGIGKSSLIQELYKPITASRGYFISGKFDQFQRNIPYSAPIAAFRGLIGQLLGESEERLQVWREKLLQALGNNGQIIIDVIPEVELIIGKQAPVPVLEANEAQNRFNLTLGNFIHVFCSREHPLILFLDDLQWTDLATLTLIERLLTDARGESLLLLGAYRDNEVSVSHPLTLTLKKLQQNNAAIRSRIARITLTPLPLDETCRLIGDTFGQPSDRVEELARLIQEKTNGNPFFINEFLQALHEEYLLVFHPQTQNWQWDIKAIAARDFTDNVVELMVEKLQQLPQGDRDIISLAACLGAEFDLTTLTWMVKRSPQEVFQLLKTALDRNFIFPISELDENLLIQSYKFAHDRIQQAAYALIPEAEQTEKNVAIGRILWEKTPESEREDKLFDIVDRLNYGISLLQDSEERERLTRLNLQAGCKARKANAYGVAIAYFEAGISLLAENSWERQYTLTFELYREAMKATYLNAEIERMETFAAVLAKEVKTLRDRLEVGKIKVDAYANQGKFTEALAVGLDTLAALGIQFPRKLARPDLKPPPSDSSILQNPFSRRLLFAIAKRIPDRYLTNSTFYPLLMLKGLAKVQETIGDRQPAELGRLPEMQDELMREILGLLVKIVPVIYLIYPTLAPLAVFKQLEISLTYGNAPASALSYAAYGSLLCRMRQEFLGYEYARVALDVFHRFDDKQFAASIGMMIDHYVTPWTKHLRETLSPLQQGFALGLEVGDLHYCGYISNAYCIHLYFSGCELSEIEKEIKHHREILEAIDQKISLQNTLMYWQNILILREGFDISYHWNGAEINDALFLSFFQNNPVFLFETLIFKSIRDYLFERFETAKATINSAKQYLEESEGTILVLIFYFYDSLIRLADLRRNQKNTLKEIEENQKKIEKWAKSAPMNHLHKFYLVEAEYYRVLGKKTKAMDFYDRAIALAKENKYIQEESLANELAAKFYLHWGKEKIANLYVKEAHYCYQRWGATAKVKYLEEKYPHLLVEVTPQTTRSLQQKITKTLTRSDSQSRESLDITSVFKATRAISSEILLDRLLSALMKILVENAGAQRGILLLANEEYLTVAAIQEIETTKEIVLLSTPLEEFPTIPVSIVRNVARTREAVFLDDATQPNSFTGDPYIQQNQCHSLACVPFINQGQLQGIAYLENNLTLGAFTKKRVESVQILAGQAAIAISNAQLYDRLKASKQQIQQLYDASKRFVPEQFLGLLEKQSIIDVELGDRVEREMTVLFSDIRDFTTISEQMTPKENFTFINNYLGRMEPLIQQYGGFIDKYIGDAIMALFSNSPDDALQAAIAMLEELKIYNKIRRETDRIPLRIGIGLHTGRLMLGMVGGADRMDGTAIGDAVNLSSRVEGLTKTYGIPLLITYPTFLELKNSSDYDFRFIERVTAKGKAKAVSLFEVFSADPPEVRDAKNASKEAFEAGAILFHQQAFSEAARLFRECWESCPGDRPARYYLERCQQYID